MSNHDLSATLRAFRDFKVARHNLNNNPFLEAWRTMRPITPTSPLRDDEVMVDYGGGQVVAIPRAVGEACAAATEAWREDIERRAAEAGTTIEAIVSEDVAQATRTMLADMQAGAQRLLTETIVAGLGRG